MNVMESVKVKIDTSVLDNIIVGRVEPHIYAFSTETVPNYLKVGDTSRGVQVRLEEWKKIFPNLIKKYEHSAQIDDETIFRDFAVHYFLEYEKGRTRLQPNTFQHLPYYSKEFFEGATIEDLNEAIKDIIQSANERNGKYQFYSPDRLPQTLTYQRTEDYAPRDNQQQAVNNFKAAVAAGRTDLLLYAVMRFGKSFTAMCCAKEIGAKIVTIVSAKADVKEEWKKTVESHVYFTDYKYVDAESLRQNETVIADTLTANGKVALFLTLQDLQGSNIKNKHKEVFDHQIDLLIIDETHFGARGASYGKVLQKQRLSKSEIAKELKSIDGFETLDKVEDAVKALKTKIRLHLSGTPYRILMSDEFQKEDIVAFVQFTDIIDAQKQWDAEHLKEDDCNEWDNPYYGFPQMIRFAFNPNESSRKKMEQMRKEGITYAFSELFRPHSMIDQPDGSHRQFVHKTEILDLLEAIDGTKEDENLLGFLDYNKINEGKMCRHIVCVLPFRASCDAMAVLIQENRTRFKNLCEYEIINIAGFDDIEKYKSTDDVKRTIKECEVHNKKTLTLTVNRMLTGTTVAQWDTMFYLKGTTSPQEYDQAIFRLQNQYITTFKDESGKTIKYNMKPQTLLVDFAPNRMFLLQELKSQFYNVNMEVQGNAQLKERIAKELEVSPIIVLNKNKLQEVTPTNITDAVREYSRTRSILDDALEIPADNGLLQDNMLVAILRNIEPIDAKNGLQIKPTEPDGDNDIDIPDGEATGSKENANQNDNPNTSPNQMESEKDDKLAKRLAAYYARVLFFAFLTESVVKSLEDVISQIPVTEDNRRIARHLDLDVRVLQQIQHKSNPFMLRKLDYKIENVNDLIRDDSLQPIKRVEVALRKFGRLSDSEVVTPAKVADEMVSILPHEEFNANEEIRFLDMAAKQGEFTIALYKKFGDKVKKSIYAIPTSKLTYEFTRKTYVLLGMPVENIFTDFTSYDLIGKDNEKIIKKLKDMKFDVVIGNPPYQEGDGGAGASAKPIYNQFVDVSKDEIGTTYLCIIMPSRWMAGGKGLDNFRITMLNDRHIVELHDFMHPEDVFPETNNRGGVCYFMRNSNYDNTAQKVKVVTHYEKNFYMAQRSLKTRDLNIFVRDSQAIEILDKVVHITSFQSMSDIISARKPFGFESQIIKTPIFHSSPDGLKKPILCYGKAARIGYVELLEVNSHKEWIDKWKVYVPESNNIGTELKDDNQNSFVGAPKTICTETYLVVGAELDLTERESAHLSDYLKTKFARFLLSLAKISQHGTSKTYRFVPMQNFSESWTDAKLYEKYNLTDKEIAFIESVIRPM